MVQVRAELAGRVRPPAAGFPQPREVLRRRFFRVAGRKCGGARQKDRSCGWRPADDLAEGESSTAVFWCLRTMETWGADQRPAHAGTCRRGRECFEACDGDGGEEIT
jgi:hypothetical protein